MDRQGVEFVPLPWVTLHWAVGVLLYKDLLQYNRSHCLTQGFFQGKDISPIIIRRTPYELGQVIYMYTLVEERHVCTKHRSIHMCGLEQAVQVQLLVVEGNGKPPPHLHFPCLR